MFLTFRLNKGLSFLAAAGAVAVIVMCCGMISPTKANAVKLQDGVRLPIIMYHSLLKENARQGKYVVSPDTFESDLIYLETNGYKTIVVQDLLNYVNKNIPLPPKPVMLTFDDGYYNNYYYAFPLIKKYNAKIVISPIGYYTDLFTKNDSNHPNYSHCTWDQINEMMRSGLVEIQDHTYNLHSSKGGRFGTQKLKWESQEAYAAILIADLSKMQQEMKDHTGYTPTAFVYPFGEICEDSIPVLKSLGFQASLACYDKMNYITKDSECLYCLSRYLRYGGMTSQQYFLKFGI